MDRKRLEEIKKIKADAKKQKKSFKTLSRPEKDELLETIAKMMGLIT